MKQKGFFTSIVLVVLLAAVVFAARDEADEKKVSVKPNQLPSKITRAIKAKFPKGQIGKIEKEIRGEDPGQYDLLVRSGGKVYEVEVSPKGKILEAKEIKAARKPAQKASAYDKNKKWTESFGEENCSFSSVGRNKYFVLEPGHQVTLANRDEQVVITVLDETEMVGDVETRIVEEREKEGGKIVEISRNFFAICKEHGDVFYFGEEVENYKNGKFVGHSGAWRADDKRCKAGIIMPGTILLGARHYQELAPNAKDRAEIVADGVTFKTPAGTFKNCIKVEETSALDADEKCYKIYAPGVGIILDEDLLLTGYSKAKDVKVSMKDLPEAVRETIKKHAMNGKITEIEKGIKGNVVVYEAEIQRNGKEIDIFVSCCGKYLGCEEEEIEDKGKDADDDEHHKGDDKDEDGEHRNRRLRDHDGRNRGRRSRA
jgi:hypothetical protein